MPIPRPSSFKTKELQRSKHLFLEKQKKHEPTKPPPAAAPSTLLTVLSLISTKLQELDQKLALDPTISFSSSSPCLSLLFLHAVCLLLLHQPSTPNNIQSQLLSSSISRCCYKQYYHHHHPPARLSYPFLQKLPKP